MTEANHRISPKRFTTETTRTEIIQDETTQGRNGSIRNDLFPKKKKKKKKNNNHTFDSRKESSKRSQEKAKLTKAVPKRLTNKVSLKTLPVRSYSIGIG